MRLALLEAAPLLLAAHREPELDQVDAAVHEVALELRRLAHEFVVLLVAAEAHHALDAGAVVPGAVEQHDLAARRQVPDVALEIPLAAFLVGRLLQRHDARAARIQVLHEALDRAALAGGVAALEQDDDLLPGLLDPGLQLEQFDLQPVLLALVALARQQVLVRVAAIAPVGGQLVLALRVGFARAPLLLAQERLRQLPARRPATGRRGCPAARWSRLRWRRRCSRRRRCARRRRRRTSARCRRTSRGAGVAQP